MIKAVSEAMLGNSICKELIVLFFLDYAGKNANCVKDEEEQLKIK